MNLRDIVSEVSEATGLSKAKTEEVIREYYLKLAAALAKEESASIGNFASYEIQHRKERNARNPKTGERVVVPARKVVRFRPRATFAEIASI